MARAVAGRPTKGADVTTTPPVRELPKVTAGSSVSTAVAIARVAKKPVVESAAPVRHAASSEPAKREIALPSGRDVVEMTLADLVGMLDKRKNGVREVYADDATDREELIETGQPIVLSRGSQASLVARMLGRR